MEDLSHYNPEGSLIRKTQLRLLEILDVFDGICRKHNINYWLVSGTLLGARRHGGFIPWDDDLDVAILQRDYKRLLTILKKELPENLKLQIRETDKKYWYYYPRIRDTRSRFYNKKGDVFDYNGIFFDVFLLEPVPSMSFKKIIDKILISDMHFKKFKSLSWRVKYGAMVCLMPLAHLLIRLSRAYYKYFSNTKAYAYSYGNNHYPTFNIDNFFPVTDIMFEGKKYMAPHNIDNYLIENFDANFMVLPKPADRYSHASKIEFF